MNNSWYIWIFTSFLLWIIFPLKTNLNWIFNHVLIVLDCVLWKASWSLLLLWILTHNLCLNLKYCIFIIKLFINCVLDVSFFHFFGLLIGALGPIFYVKFHDLLCFKILYQFSIFYWNLILRSQDVFRNG